MSHEPIKALKKNPAAHKYRFKPGSVTNRYIPASPVVHHYRALGNQAIQCLLESGTIQAALKIGLPNDRYEQEADRAAELVMRMPEPGIQRQTTCPECMEEEEELIRTKPLAEQITPLVQKQVEPAVEEKEEEELQAKDLPGRSLQVGDSIESRLNTIKQGGQSLPGDSRSFFESRFGADFSQVRVHSDTKASDAARSVNARAFTLGKHIVFGAGQYLPGTLDGSRLLAHELTHVVQQSAATRTQDSTLQRIPRQDTHAGLFEMTRHRPLGGPTFSPQAQYDVRIEFLPYRIVNCGRIAMTQTLISRVRGALVHPSAAQRRRALTARQGTEGVSIDRLSGRTLPYYGTTNTGATARTAHFGSRTGRNPADRAWIEDTPGFTGIGASRRTRGETLSQHFETCAICNLGTDRDAYFGCVSWGYDIDAADNFTEAGFGRVSKGTPSADFLAAARNWNAQTTPAATTDLPIPGHTTRNVHMTLAQLNAEIRALATRRRGLAAGHADLPQVTFELRVLRDIRNAIRYNENQGYVGAVIRDIQRVVGARQDGVWGYDTIRRVKIWQARHGLVTDGRVGPITFSRMGLHRAGDYPLPDTSPTATRVV
jgi:peptidoglycan hydrolase-like protein with peptidoglycan-binding domain